MKPTLSDYDSIASLYHLVYTNWEEGIQRQGDALDRIIKKCERQRTQSVLDVSCGIGTQSIALAQRGYQVTASDLSTAEVKRARREAKTRHLSIDFSVANMKDAYTHHQRQFDLVLSCDNSFPHLLTREDRLQALRQFYECTIPHGLCLISLRDYSKETIEGIQLKPYGVRIDQGKRYIVFQVWDCNAPFYDLSMYFVEDEGKNDGIAHVMRSRYYVLPIEELVSLMEEVGFSSVQRIDDSFFQPVIVGHKDKSLQR